VLTLFIVTVLLNVKIIRGLYTPAHHGLLSGIDISGAVDRIRAGFVQASFSTEGSFVNSKLLSTTVATTVYCRTTWTVNGSVLLVFFVVWQFD